MELSLGDFGFWVGVERDNISEFGISNSGFGFRNSDTEFGKLHNMDECIIQFARGGSLLRNGG